MKKDLHVGLAIGGVLLAVLIVWGVVVSGSKKHKEVTLQTTTGGSEIPAPNSTGPDQSPAPAPVADPGTITPPTIIMPGPPPASDTPAPATSAKKGDEWIGLLAGTTPAPAISGADAAKTDSTPAPVVTQSPDAGTPLVTAALPPSQQIPAPTPLAADAPSNPASAASPAAQDSPPHRVAVDAPAAASVRTHTVQRGETFASISKAVYGDARYYQQIAKANPKINPNRVRPGTVINLPDASDVKASSSSKKPDAASPAASTSNAAKRAAPAVDSQTEYRVVSGDSLYRISMHLYGSGEEADHLYELNKDKIGPNKGILKLGMVLKIPSPPSVQATASR